MERATEGRMGGLSEGGKEGGEGGGWEVSREGVRV